MRPSGARRRARVLLGLAVLAAAVVWVVREPVLQGAGDFLVVEDPIQPADAAIAVSGNGRERVETAAALVRQGAARWLILSGGPPGLPGSAVELVRYAREAGADPEIVLADDGATSTVGNAERSAAVMEARGLRSAILVTSPYHMRRAILIFRSVFGPRGLSVRAFPARQAFFDPHRWWTRRQDRALVVREYLKLAAFLVGVR